MMKGSNWIHFRETTSFYTVNFFLNLLHNMNRPGRLIILYRYDYYNMLCSLDVKPWCSYQTVRCAVVFSDLIIHCTHLERESLHQGIDYMICMHSSWVCFFVLYLYTLSSCNIKINKRLPKWWSNQFRNIIDYLFRILVNPLTVWIKHNVWFEPLYVFYHWGVIDTYYYDYWYYRDCQDFIFFVIVFITIIYNSH